MTTSTPISGRSLSDVRPDVAATWHPTKNGNVTPDQVRPGSNTMAWWQCLVDDSHVWQALISSRTTGRGCPKCAMPRHRLASLAIEEPDIAAQWHPSLNEGLTASAVSAGSSMVVWWKCSVGHTWQQSICSRRKSAKKCPICVNKRLLVGFNDLATKRPDIAAQWHPSLNGTLRTCDVFSSTTRVVWWHCSTCDHSYRRSISSMIRSQGCPKCMRRSRRTGRPSKR